MKKLLATLLSALICFSSLTGLTVFAEETEPATQPDTQPTTTEQITTTTTPKSTIPGGAYVTYNLTNVISSNMQEEVWGYYETTLSPEPGYKINYISVKQGDKDMPVIDNGDGTYTFKNEDGFTDNLTITAGAEILTTSETSQEYSTTTEPESSPITTTTTPKSTIPGGAYVTYNLTNVISSNMQEEVWGYYETTLSPEPGYKINYISVKQGDKDMPVIDNGDGTYTFKNEVGFTDNLTITVKAKPFPTKLSVTDMNLYVGSSSVIDVIDGTAIEWKSSDEQVATVDNGKVLGVGVGTATITVTLSTYDHLTCKVKVLDYAQQPLPSTTQKFCDAVNQYIIDCGFEEMYFVETDENGNKVMLTPDNIKSNGAIKIYLETTNFAIFNIRGALTACSEETVEGYIFNYNTTFTNDNPCGYCVYKNNKIYSIKDAVNKGITDIRTLASVIPGTTKDGVPVTVNKNESVKVNYLYDCKGDCFSFTNKPNSCKIGSRFLATIKAKSDKNAITYMSVLMGKDTFVDAIEVDESTYIIDIPYVTGDITMGALVNDKVYPAIGEELDSFATNMDNVSFYRYYSSVDATIPIENQIYDCAVAPYDIKIVPDEGYEIVSVTRKIRHQNYENGEYEIYEEPVTVTKLEDNSYLVPGWGKQIILEGEVRKIQNQAKLSESQLTLKAGETKTLKVTDGTAKAWSTSNKNVATVNNGKVTAVGKGTATITATLTTGEKLTCKVTVVNSPKLTLSNVILKSGASRTIKAVGGTVKSWTTSNKNVAIVNNGKITSLNKGTATVTATLTTGKKLNCKVVVSTAPRLTRTTVKVKKGNTVTVAIVGKVATIDNKYTNTKIAKINSKVSTSILKIKGLKKGETTLKIKVNGVKTLSLKVKVK